MEKETAVEKCVLQRTGGLEHNFAAFPDSSAVAKEQS
jgi:hypothetical protein